MVSVSERRRIFSARNPATPWDKFWTNFTVLFSIIIVIILVRSNHSFDDLIDYLWLWWLWLFLILNFSAISYGSVIDDCLLPDFLFGRCSVIYSVVSDGNVICFSFFLESTFLKKKVLLSKSSFYKNNTSKKFGIFRLCWSFAYV